jgi:RHS repeat-associated protein
MTDTQNSQPYQLPTPEGRAIAPAVGTGGAWIYEYDYKDHLGNTRLSYKEQNGKLLKTAETAYDPWGMVLAGISQKNNPANRWELQGHEKESTFGLNRIQFGARTYNPTIGRFDEADPLAEVMNNFSPYAYCYDNPINFFDNDGMIPLPQIIRFSRMGRGVSSNSWNPTHKVKRPHKGVDLQTGGKQGLKVSSAAAGTVQRIGWDKNGWGRYVIIRHNNGYFSLYAHLKKNGVLANVGDDISNGEVIALSCNTGGSTGPHLHLEFRKARSTNGSFKNSTILNPYEIDDLQDLTDGDEKSKLEVIKPKEISFGNSNVIKLPSINLPQSSASGGGLDLFYIQTLIRMNQSNEEKPKESKSGMEPGAPPNN